MLDPNQAPLAPVARGGRRRRLLWVVPRVLVLVVVLGAKFYMCSPRELDCKTAVRTASPSMAVVVCQREYQSTRDAHTGVRLADSLRRSGDRTGARAIATELLARDEVRANALQI